MKTVNLELSKELKKAGYPQESDFIFCRPSIAYDNGNIFSKDFHILRANNNGIYTESYAAPTADEILEQLLDFIDYDGKIFNLTVTHEISGWNVAYLTSKDVLLTEFMYKSLADAAAKMWLYLRGENLLYEKENSNN